MRFGVAALLAVLLGAFLAHSVLADRGYVLVSFRGYVIEMSVPGLVIMLVLAYFGVRTLVTVIELPRRWRAARARRRLERRDAQLTRAQLQLQSGDAAAAFATLQELEDSQQPVLAASGENEGALHAVKSRLQLVSSAAAEPLPPARGLAPPEADAQQSSSGRL